MNPKTKEKLREILKSYGWAVYGFAIRDVKAKSYTMEQFITIMNNMNERALTAIILAVETELWEKERK